MVGVTQGDRPPRVTGSGAAGCDARPREIGQFAVIQAMATPHRVELSPINAGDPAEMERGIAPFARAFLMPDWW